MKLKELGSIRNTVICFALIILCFVAASIADAAPIDAVQDTAQPDTDCKDGLMTVGPCPEGYALPPLYAEFLSFDSGSGLGATASWDGWTYNSDIGYGARGWLLDIDEDGPLGGGEIYLNGQTRMLDKTDYGFGSTVEFSTDIAPTKSTGKSLRVIQSDDTTDNRVTWWLWYDGKPLSERGVTNTDTNRMSFYLKTEGMDEIGSNDTLPSTQFDIGTYLCWTDLTVNNPGSGTGKGCPYEGIGNQHYYHFLTFNPDMWIHVLLNRWPQNLRGEGAPTTDHPSMVSDGKSYYEQMNQIYVQTSSNTTTNPPQSFYIDEMTFHTDSMPQNEAISSLWVGYSPSNDYWEIGFNDMSGLNNKTYEVRWSDSEITNDNFLSANLITPQYYGGTVETGNANRFRKKSKWYAVAWTRFTIANSSSKGRVYFAVKDVSVNGSNTGTGGQSDDANAFSNNVTRIDYVVDAGNL